MNMMIMGFFVFRKQGRGVITPEMKGQTAWICPQIHRVSKYFGGEASWGSVMGE